MANSETIRSINSSRILDLIRIGQPVSRAELARRTGLQRSSVSIIVNELIRKQWITEGERQILPRGRQPLALRLNRQRSRILGINVRPRHTDLVLADFNLGFEVQQRWNTPSQPEAFITQLIPRVRSLLKNSQSSLLEGVGISLPGRVDAGNHMLIFAPNLGWRQVDLKTPLEAALGVPVHIENAANACALAEVWAGPHAGAQDLVVVTVSEGIGTGMIANGRLVRGSSGAAGEFGHICLAPEGPICRCGGRGCWEVLASNSAALRYYNQPPGAATSPPREPRRLQLRDFNELISRFNSGDARAISALQQMARYLGQGIAMLANCLAPGCVVVVGEMTAAWDTLGPVIEAEAAALARTHALPRIEPSDDHLQPRLRGAVAMVLHRYFRPGLMP